MATKVKSILTIAGSDPSGGAGIQADLKTFTVLGVYGCAAITNLTVQNTQGVFSCHSVEPEIVFQQIRAVLDDLLVSHIKIGMVGSGEVAEAITKAIDDFDGEIIYDPVMTASSGETLLEQKDSSSAISGLIGKATVLTPNLNELEQITGKDCTSTESALQAAIELFSSFPEMKSVIVKGGHLDKKLTQVTDYLLLKNFQSPEQIISSSHGRVQSTNTHGTGCTFASAFAAFHQQTNNYEQAFNQSSEFISRLLSTSASSVTGQGTGGMLHHLFEDGE